MEPQSGPPDYWAGDDIVLELTVDHEFELEDITAIFEHEGVELAAEEISERNTVIELKTRRGSTPPVRAFHSAPRGSPTSPARWSCAAASARPMPSENTGSLA